MYDYTITKGKANANITTFPFQDNSRLIDTSKSKNAGCADRRGRMLDMVLIYCLLFSRLVGKSSLPIPGDVWRIQMATVVILVVIGLLYNLFMRLLGRQACSRLTLKIKVCLIMLLVWCLPSCFIQQDWLGNLVFFLVFAGMVYLLFVKGSDLRTDIFKKRSIDIVLLPLAFITLISLVLFPRLTTDGRYNGFYCDSIVAGQMFGLTSLLLFWEILHTESKRVLIYWIFFPFAILCLLLTRTRTDILGTTFGMVVCLVAAMHGGTMTMSKRRARMVLISLALFLLLCSVWLTQAGAAIDRTRDYLRLTGSPEQILCARSPYWQIGKETLDITNIFGNGPLAKFGGQLSTQESGYVRESNAHNTFLSVFQFYGWPAGVLFIVFLILVGSNFVKRKDHYATLGISLLSFGLVQGMSENWLLSFGTPVDAYSWFIMGLTIIPLQSSTSTVISTDRPKNMQYLLISS